MKALFAAAAALIILGIVLLGATAGMGSGDGAAWPLFIGGAVLIVLGIGAGIAGLVSRANQKKTPVGQHHP